MIRIIHNNVEKTLDVSSCENLDEVVQRCALTEEGDPHLFTRICIDGLELPEDSFERLCDHSIAGVGEINMESRPTTEIAWSSLKHSSEYVQSIRSAIERVVELFRLGRAEDANQLMANVADSMGIVIGAVVGIAGVLTETAAPIIQAVDDLAPWLDEVVTGQVDGDWVRVSDILEYEVDPRLSSWAKTMEAIWTEANG